MQVFRFNNVTEYLDTVENRKRYGESGRGLGISEWYGTETWDEAIDLAHKGWREGAEYIKRYQGRISETIQTQHVNRGEWRKSRTGGAVRVPSYVQGRPDCFLNYRQVRETKFVTVVYVGGASAEVRVETIINKGAMVTAAIDMLESHNIRVKLVLAYGSNRGPGEPNLGELYVTLKEHNESLDLDRVAFWLANPAALRRIRFAFYETVEDELTRSVGNGHGHSSDVSDQGDIYITKSHSSDRVWVNLDASIAYVKQALSKNGIAL